MNDEPGGVGQIAKAIRAYLKENPRAADTLEGISACWLAQGDVPSCDDVLRALERLVSQGQLEKHISPDGRRLFRKRR